MQEKEEPIQIRVNLEGQYAQAFNRIKDFLGLKNNSEVIRTIVMEKARSLGGSQ